MRETYFASVERTHSKRLKQQIDTISHSPVMNALLKTMSGLLIVVNENRQIIALNHTFLDSFHIKDPKKVLGFRLGETLDCKHATKPPYGCGTTPHCATCGAVLAMMTAINEDKTGEKICALTSVKNGVEEDLSLMIRAQPITIENQRWILVFAQDITLQQFWVNLESVFFHDINNLIMPLVGYSELLAMDFPDNTMIRDLKEGVVRLSSEISLQRTLSHFKDATYLLNREVTSAREIRREIERVVEGHHSKANRSVQSSWPNEPIGLITDTYLVSRVVTNMILNALEATNDGGVVKLNVSSEKKMLHFEIWNASYISEDVQKRVFQRHFSTKSNLGRGLGTYSMKLFGEKYLKGEVFFESVKRKGTTFHFRLPLDTSGEMA